MAIPKILDETPDPEDFREVFYDWITPGLKAEYINEEIIVHSPAKLEHNDAMRNILTLLNVYCAFHKRGHVGAEKMMIALTRNDYEPDVLYHKTDKAKRFVKGQWKFPAPDLVVEVLSSTTEERDRGVKFRDYAAHEVAEYWIVDPDEQTIEQYELEEGAVSYSLREKLKVGDTISSHTIEGLSFPVLAAFEGNALAACVVRWSLDLSRPNR